MLMYWKNRAVNGVWKLQRRVYEVLRNEDGVGTVEVVLLILENQRDASLVCFV